MDNRQGVVLFVLLIIYTAVVSYIGYRNRGSNSSEAYFLASRQLPAWLLAITFIASWWGGGSAIDLVDQAYAEGISTFWIYGVPVLLSTALMFLFAAGIRRVNTLSQPELIEKRYDRRSSLMLTIFILVFMTIGAAVQVIVVGRLLDTLLGVGYVWGAVIGTLMVVFYSLFGGFRGVVLTDLLQFGFFLFSTFFLFFLAYNRSGGFGEMLVATEARDIPSYTDFFHNIGSNLAFVVTFGTSWMIQANVWQRISAARTPSAARKMMSISFFVFIPLYLIVTLTGMLALPLFDELPEGGIVSAMLVGLDSDIIRGVIFVGLCSAIMSTMDSMLNTGALTLTVDLYKKYINPNATPKSYVTVGRLSTLIVGAIALFIGVSIQSVITISWIGADFIATGVFVPLVLGFVWRRGTADGSFASMIFGLVFSLYNLLVAVGVNLPTAWDIASTKQAIIGIVSSFIIYVVVSLLTKPNNEKSDNFIKTVDLKH
ncbi:MAG: sodium:solute symporter family protein [Rikenellaceae bacterium]